VEIVIEWKIIHFDVLESTNGKALELAHKGAEEGIVVLADSQTAGRGRFGRKWYSPPGQGLFFSAILHPPFTDRRLFVLPLGAGCAVAAALKSVTGLAPRLKWPNDVLIGEKKVSGILIETSQVSGRFAAVIGIGININNTDFPEEISQTATSILLECKREVSSSALLDICLHELSDRYEHFISGRSEKIVREAREISSLLGRQVRIPTSGGEFHGNVVDLDETGALVVRLRDGAVRAFTTGEVQLVREASDDNDSGLGR
jgi:BirA family biotin operon repressor/biotin-[acetyl-CoA-carboxylase] ligase